MIRLVHFYSNCRIGRTARAGANGRAIPFITDEDRVILKTIVKTQHGVSLKTRMIPGSSVIQMQTLIDDVTEDFQTILAEEKEEAYLRKAEMEANKASNVLRYEKDIQARPRREWFQSEKAKGELRKKMSAAFSVGGGAHDRDGESSEKGVKYEQKASMKEKRAREKAQEEANAGSAPNKKQKKTQMTEKEAEMEVARIQSRGFKARQRQLTQNGVNPRAAAKMAAAEVAMRNGVGPKKKMTATTKGLFAENPAERTVSVYAGGAKSQKLKLPKTGLSDKEKKAISRKGKGKAAFKSKAKFKRR